MYHCLINSNVATTYPISRQNQSFLKENSIKFDTKIDFVYVITMSINKLCKKINQICLWWEKVLSQFPHWADHKKITLNKV